MEESWLNRVILNFFLNRVDIFPPKSTYKGFQTADKSTQNDDPSDKNGFFSAPQFGQIVYRDESGNIHKSDPIVLKIMPGISPTKFTSFYYINEMNFYTKILPTLSSLNESFGSLFPKFYHGEMIFNVGKDESMMILEDLNARGFQMAAKKSFLDLDHLMLMMRKLGEFHAFSYKAKNCIPELFYPLIDNIHETNFILNWEFRDMLRCIGQRGLEHLQRDPKYEKYIPKMKTLLEKADTTFLKILTGDKRNSISVFCHGDYLRNNILFRYENKIPVDMKLVDMAMCRYASPVFDLLSVLYMNSDQEMRNAHWDTLIDEYYTALQTKFPENQVPTKSDILSEFVDKSFCGYSIASYFLTKMIADDNNIPITMDLDPETEVNFLELKVLDIPLDKVIQLCNATGGQLGTQALGDILGDMIDRGFICEL